MPLVAPLADAVALAHTSAGLSLVLAAVACVIVFGLCGYRALTRWKRSGR
ncbi:hypothetical protein GCM10017673_26240 [Streptosporangium violaceochromogenes]|nr:hypothetical protein GCM10017673_26240 [Streptosporangium violaceochromogenes]